LAYYPLELGMIGADLFSRSIRSQVCWASSRTRGLSGIDLLSAS